MCDQDGLLTVRSIPSGWGRCKAFEMIFQSEREAGMESSGSYFSTIRRFSSELRTSISRRRSSFSISRRSSNEGVLSSIEIRELQKDDEPPREDEGLEDEGPLGGYPNKEEKVVVAVADDLEIGHSIASSLEN